MPMTSSLREALAGCDSAAPRLMGPSPASAFVQGCRVCSSSQSALICALRTRMIASFRFSASSNPARPQVPDQALSGPQRATEHSQRFVQLKNCHLNCCMLNSGAFLGAPDKAFPARLQSPMRPSEYAQHYLQYGSGSAEPVCPNPSPSPTCCPPVCAADSIKGSGDWLSSCFASPSLFFTNARTCYTARPFATSPVHYSWYGHNTQAHTRLQKQIHDNWRLDLQGPGF